MSALVEWKSFATTCYPDGMTAEQEKQLRRAFFAGALISVQLFQTAVNTETVPDEIAAVQKLEAFAKEVESECAAQAKSCEARN